MAGRVTKGTFTRVGARDRGARRLRPCSELQEELCAGLLQSPLASSFFGFLAPHLLPTPTPSALAVGALSPSRRLAHLCEGLGAY